MEALDALTEGNTLDALTEGNTLDALTEGNTLDALTALRQQAAANLIAAEPKEFAGVSREYRAILAELERRGAGREVSELDEIAARRRQRRARKQAAAGS